MDTPLTRPIAAAHTEKHRIHLPNDVTASLVMVDSASPTPAGRLRPKMRTVMPDHGRSLMRQPCHAYKTSSATLSRTEALTRMPTLRPLPSVPDLPHVELTSLNPSCNPCLLIGPRARKRRSQVSQPSRPSTPPSTSVSIPSSRVPSPQPTHIQHYPLKSLLTPTHPRRLPVPRAGLVDPHDTKANEIQTDHLDLIDLASSISRMWTPSQARTSLDDERDRPEFVGWTTDSSLPPPVPPKSPPLDWKTLKPSRLLLPGIGLVEDRHEDDEDESMASSPVKFLNDLTPSKRHTVLTIITLLADEESDHSDSDRTESESEDEGRGERPDWERKWEEADVKGGLEGKLGPDIGLWEFAKRTKKRVRAPALIRKFSHKWEREKDGKRWAEDDYANVLGFLRRL
ncbi:hypothetical protein DFP72DRAFT_907036 [Ephemerocybe angulata]|uniref:Uncharacterized protein n=1 Tax=Ephemerocybe angulata TaxID=980116 RepID=A0A8H6M4D8_9AGAR|nr:hypothetical protein DFP72DRAFT_907036 [Tulosesus angulatus]